MPLKAFDLSDVNYVQVGFSLKHFQKSLVAYGVFRISIRRPADKLPAVDSNTTINI